MPVFPRTPLIAAVLAMLFNAVGVPGPPEPAGTSADQTPDVVMMVLVGLKSDPGGLAAEDLERVRRLLEAPGA